jgi:putative ABC transport system permease protein
MGGVQNEARITSLRKVDWGSMRANFFVMYPVASLEGRARHLHGAFRAPDRRALTTRWCASSPTSPTWT